MVMRSALYSINTLSWIFIVLAHRINSPRIDMLPHSDTLSWFRANQSLLFLLNAACLYRRSNKYQFYSLWFDTIGARIHDLPHSRRSTFEEGEVGISLTGLILPYCCTCAKIWTGFPTTYDLVFLRSMIWG